jgi:hypothetical protein
MEHKKPFESFAQDAHEKAQAALDPATEIRMTAEEQRRRKQAGEPHLIAAGTLQRCSVCGCSFPADVHPSMSVAFYEHVTRVH